MLYYLTTGVPPTPFKINNTIQQILHINFEWLKQIVDDNPTKSMLLLIADIIQDMAELRKPDDLTKEGLTEMAEFVRKVDPNELTLLQGYLKELQEKQEYFYNAAQVNDILPKYLEGLDGDFK